MGKKTIFIHMKYVCGNVKYNFLKADIIQLKAATESTIPSIERTYDRQN